jgi:hypothetical protein
VTVDPPAREEDVSSCTKLAIESPQVFNKRIRHRYLDPANVLPQSLADVVGQTTSRVSLWDPEIDFLAHRG